MNLTATFLYLTFFLALVLCCTKPEQQPQHMSPDQAVESMTTSGFVDVTQAAGLSDFWYVNGAAGEKLFPESMGSGCGFIDYNNDGWLDLLLVGGGNWPDHGVENVPALWLYRNNKDGTFTETSNEAGLGNLHIYGFGVTVADYDNDDDQDFYFSTLYENMLFRNDGGRFKEVGFEAGVDGGAEWSSSAIFFDADLDGWLDLYVGNYVIWSIETDLWCSLDGNTKGYCTPEVYQGLPGRYFHNNGDGTFSDQTNNAGFLPSPGKSLGVTDFDYNRDGWPDLIVTNDTERYLLYENDGDGTFTERGAISGIAYDENGRTRAGMGCDAGVVDDTGEETVFVGNFSKEMIAAYRHIGNGLFIDRSAPSKIGRASLIYLTFSVMLFDVDLDCDLDLFAANGHVQMEAEKLQDGITYEQTPNLFINDGHGTFQDESTNLGGVFAIPIVARGAAFGDYDRDGRVDLLITENAGPVRLWRNEVNPDPRYLRVHLEGRSANRDGIDAEVQAIASNKTMHRRVRTGSSFLSNSEKTVTFGLGNSSQVDTLIVKWPGGTTEQFHDVQGNTEILIVEGAGEVVPRQTTQNQQQAQATH